MNTRKKKSSQPLKILLASQSPYRKAQLRDLGLKFSTCAPDYDEDILKGTGLAPKALARALAIGKAKSLAARYPQHLIIGADQLVAAGRQILGKPGNFANAVKQLKSRSGKSHQLITAIAISHKGKIVTRTVIATIQMHRLSDSEIREYVKRDKPFDCAGSYRFEKGGLSLVRKMRVSDPSSLIGLPLIEVSSIIRQFTTAKGLK